MTGDRLIVVDGAGRTAAELADLVAGTRELLAAGAADAIAIVRPTDLGHEVELRVGAGPGRARRLRRLRATIAAVAEQRGEVADALTVTRKRAAA